MIYKYVFSVIHYTNKITKSTFEYNKNTVKNLTLALAKTL